jgi:branched-chain amino acid transport system permease protein
VDVFLLTAIQIVDSIANLALVGFGLAVIFGMMRVINLAHGEFIMLGGFAAVFATNAGVNIWLAMLVAAPLAVGLVGFLVERLIIRRLYGRMIDTMLATWGLSLLLIGLATSLFGNRVMGIAAPLASFDIGGYSVSIYDQVIVVVCVLVYAAGYLILRLTRWGLIARATMQNAEMAASLGVARSKVFATTFTIGAVLSGLAGGLIAPLSGVVPTMGAAYVAKAFITVITGGTNAIAGTAVSAGVLGAISTWATFLTTPVIGDVAMLAAAIIFLRLLPRGVSGGFRGGST